MSNIKTIDLRGLSESSEYTIEDADMYQAILFITRHNVRVICNGADFQEFVWGADRYTLWIPCGNVMKCVIGKYLLEKISDEIILVRKDKARVNIHEIPRIIDEIKRGKPRTCQYTYFFIIPSNTHKIVNNLVFIRDKNRGVVGK